MDLLQTNTNGQSAQQKEQLTKENAQRRTNIRSSLTFIIIGIFIGVFISTNRFVENQGHDNIPSKKIVLTETIYNKLRSGLSNVNVSMPNPEKAKEIANALSTNETLQIQMTTVNEKLKRELKKEEKQLASMKTELIAFARKEQELKKQLREAKSSASSTTSVTPVSYDVNNPKSLESLLEAHKQLQSDMMSGKKPMRALTYGSGGHSDVGGFGNRMIGILVSIFFFSPLQQAQNIYSLTVVFSF
jgi:uncharacterized protein involved in exopolysaccharide biosynthesis